MRTEEEVLKDFEKLGWEVTLNETDFLVLCYGERSRFAICKHLKSYSSNGLINMRGHKLIHELFQIYKWL